MLWTKSTPRDGRGAGVDLGAEKGRGAGRRGPRIRCPQCAWEPRRASRWRCLCDHVWNTFDTGGLCPSCGFQWEKTCCLSCLAWSRHADWYADDDSDHE